MTCTVVIVALAGCSPLPATQSSAPEDLSSSKALPATEMERTGIASYLSDEFHGQLTASGVPYDKDAMVAAHPNLPFETEVMVTRLDSGQSVTVTIVDRLPEKVESIIDLSSAAATELGMIEAGEANVRIEIVGANP